MNAFLYIVGACDNPNHLTCQVPYRVNDQRIFFSPCKIGFRETLRQDLGTASYRDLSQDKQYLVIGFDARGGGDKTVRNILWAGITTRVMTFEFAYNHLSHPAWKDMRTLENSPLHLQPLYSPKGDFVGYRHCSKYHNSEPDDTQYPDWVRDVCSSTSLEKKLIRKEDSLYLQPNVTRYQAFDRDCCFLCENIFFAEGKGMPVDDHIREILQRTQPDRKPDDVTTLAVFGKQSNGAIHGRRGSGLTITDQTITANLLDHIRRNKPKQPLNASKPSRRKSGC